MRDALIGLGFVLAAMLSIGAALLAFLYAAARLFKHLGIKPESDYKR